MAPSVESAILSEVKNCMRQHEQRDHDDEAGGGAGGDQGADEHHVDESQQEHREQHAYLQAAVFAEL